MEPVILASSSPRRQEILKMLNIPFRVIIPELKEKIPDDIETEKIPEFLSVKKVEAVAKSMPAGSEIPWIVGADTLIILNDKIYGKPGTQEEAIQTLKELQGKIHKAITGIALYNGKTHSVSGRSSVNRVTFSRMSEKEINWYVETGDWHGAAGGYRIQGLASCFIKEIRGTHSSVVGLPIFELYDMLKEQGYSLAD